MLVMSCCVCVSMLPSKRSEQGMLPGVATQRREVVAHKSRFNTQRLWDIGAAILGATGVVVAGLPKIIPHAPPWLSAVLIVAGMVVELASRLTKWPKSRAQWTATVDALLLQGPPLPTVAIVDPYDLGVFRSNIAEQYSLPGQHPPYVRRDVDNRLEDAFKSESFVLIVGPSKAGKSRTAFEAINRVFPDHKLITPRKATSLADLFKLDPPLDLNPYPAVLWLDDLERYLDEGTLDSKMLDDWREGSQHVMVVATMRETEHERLRNTPGDIGRTVRLVLDRATEIRLRAQLSTKELAETQRQYPGQHIIGGIGEHLSAAAELLTKFQDGYSTCPEGVALVLAAVDWHRAGLVRPIPDSALQTLYVNYLLKLRPMEEISDTHYARGLQWAREPLVSCAALLVALDDGGGRSYQVFDYIIDYIDQQDEGSDESS